MTWGITTLRDKWPNVNMLSTFKGVVLSITCRDISDALEADVEVIQTRLFGGPITRRPDLSKYEGLVLVRHPFSACKSPGLVIAPMEHSFNQLRDVLDFEGPFKTWNYVDLPEAWPERAGRTLAQRCAKPDSNVSVTQQEVVSVLSSEQIDNEVTKAKRNRQHHIIGDSHAFSSWQPDASVYGLQGKTLYRALSDGLDSLVEGSPSRLSLNFGNTDLRHHLARKPEPLLAAKELAEDYVRQASKLNYDVTLYGLLPNIKEDSKFYKSYQYKDEFHAGSIDLRDEIRNRFNDVLLKSGLNVLMPPDALHNEHLQMRSEMHETRGPHLKPKAMGWSLTTDKQQQEYTWL